MYYQVILQRAQTVNMHTTTYDIIQVLWLGRPDNEATWVSASFLPSSVISLRKVFVQLALSKKTTTMARKPLPLVLQNSISMIQNEYIDHDQLLKKPQGKNLIIIILYY